MLYDSEFKRLQSSLEYQKRELINELKELPEGVFYSYESKGYLNYSERLPKGGNRKKEHRTGVTRNPARLFSLVRKEYVTEALEIIDRDLKLIREMAERFEPIDENSVMEDFVKEHPNLTEGIYRDTWKTLAEKSGEEARRSVKAKPEEGQSLFYEDGLKSTAADGTKRRSLGEVVIGSRLNYYEIPYEFEKPFAHPDLRGRFSPDFTIVRPRDGKVIYWEHIGKVNDEAYLAYNKYKLNEYEKYGIVPWNNLIVSYGQSDYGINEKLIDGLIQGWLL